MSKNNITQTIFLQNWIFVSKAMIYDGLLPISLLPKDGLQRQAS